MSRHHDELLPFFGLEPPAASTRRRFLQLFGGGIVVGAAIANAVFDAVGARVLRMPLTPARVKAALPARSV
jgi:hypothetical protein